MNRPLPPTAAPTGAQDEVRIDRNLALDLVDRIHEHGRNQADDGYQQDAVNAWDAAENLAARIRLSGSPYIALDPEAAEYATDWGML